MSFEEAEVLRERARAFLTNAARLVEEGVFDLAAFCLEQSCQLLAKYKLLVKTDTYPRTHSLIRLLRLLAKISPKLEEFLGDEQNVIYLTKLEDAYIGARYLPRRYEEKEVRALQRFVEEVYFPLVEQL